MSNHNYSQYSNNKKKKSNNRNIGTAAQAADNKPKVEETVVEDTVTTVAAPTEPVEIKMESFEPAVDVVVETVETVTLPATITGTVTGCSKLNVRAKPSTDSEVVIILNGDSEVEIDPARSTNEWLKITTAAGVEGFCMRKFVNAKP